MAKEIYLNILDTKQLKILPKLGFLRKEYGFYLGGGTALALQIGHRSSVDFDFYTPKDFDPKRLYTKLKKNLKQTASEHMADGTLIITADGVGISFFRYEYPLLKPLVKTECLNLLSIEDISAMKIISIVQRGTKRDFIDIFYILKRFTLDKLLKLTEEKYEVFNRYLGLRALTYFEDAEQDRSRRRLKFFEEVDWDKIKGYIIDVVDKYSKEHLPKK